MISLCPIIILSPCFSPRRKILYYSGRHIHAIRKYKYEVVVLRKTGAKDNYGT
jgi:hypothetical protein